MVMTVVVVVTVVVVPLDPPIGKCSRRQEGVSLHHGTLTDLLLLPSSLAKRRRGRRRRLRSQGRYSVSPLDLIGVDKMKKRRRRTRNRTFSIPKIQHSLGPDESAVVKSAFRIDPHTGTLTLAAPLDRETMAQYSFTVTDPKPPFTSTRVTVLVQDYNDNPPVFAKDTYVTAVPEDTVAGTAVVTLSVMDADESVAELDFFITSGDPDS
ncbi:cadherin-3-like isoform X1 [Eriocheir sinensis]|uniref:cadherin-3-like isoform X1 n=2 Tax=Eriocheir sinensis TaxID=95602 RepID=UPI0021C97854|nr:cadherin-3-like isoform X1 [Eriocheir sinensis]XP_050733189.1 cadherin-3-like isoform X1 [Eriocheir sinensis]XP_050733190.1 cadherin-3-like isoform X1 [Eriocheir sinensis]